MSSDRIKREYEFISRMLQKSVQKMNTEVCEQCGKCTSACPVSKEIEDFNPRKLVSQIALGKIDEVIAGEAIWTCTTCLKCKERCPEEISPYDIILILRNLAYREGLNYPVGYDDANLGLGIKHEVMNKLHNHFEVLQGTVENLSEYYKLADYPTKYAIRQLNNICHGEVEAKVLKTK